MFILSYIMALLLKLQTFILRKLSTHVARSSTPAVQPTIKDIEVLYKSSNYIIVNKCYDVIINSDDPDRKVTVQNQLTHLYPELARNELRHGFHFVNRLDFATSGLHCIALNPQAASTACKCFQQRTAEKYYLALVRGHVSKEGFEINLHIGTDSRQEWKDIRMASAIQPYAKNCKLARTVVLVLQKGLYSGYPATKVLLKPLTGRRHQLRLHLSEIGHTIIGDFTYSYRRDILPYRMFLHSYRLVIPAKDENINVITEDPFTEGDSRNCWRSVEILNKLNDEAFTKINEYRSL